MNISDFLRTALLNHAFEVSNYVPPTTVWAGLYTLPPTSAGGGTEVIASDYARVNTSWSVASLGTIQNLLDIRFPANGTTQSNWGTVSTLGLFDSLTGGNMLWFGALSAPVVLNLGASFDIAPAFLTVNLS